MQKLTQQEIAQSIKELNGWQYQENQVVISKTYKFSTYLAGAAFVSQVANLAEEHNHHPDLHLGWCKVSVTLSTHDVAGLSHKDFALAKAIDELNNF